MNNFFYLSGVILWCLIGCVAIAFLIILIAHFIVEDVKPTLINLWFYFFPFRKWKGQYSTIWYKNYARRSGVRQHWKSWKYLRRLVYIRVLKESKKEIHKNQSNEEDNV